MKKFSFPLISALVTAILLSGCTEAENSNANTNPPGEIEAIWQLFTEAWEAEDAAACASFYHSEALNIPSEFNINKGRDEIESFYQFLFNSNRSSDYSHKTESISFSENLAVEFATFTVNWINNDGEPWTYRARVLVHWQSDETGNWLIKNFLFNTPPAAEELL